MFVIPFPATVLAELRREMQKGKAPVREPSPARRLDADIDTEIAERFRNMQQAFLKVDENHDGKITKRELLQKCKEWNIPDSEATRVLGEADTDLDGTLSFDEFAKRFNSALPYNPHQHASPHRPPSRPSSRPNSRGAAAAHHAHHGPHHGG